MTSLELIHVIDARVLERARRLEAAIKLLQAGKTRREASGIMSRQFRITQCVAWRIVDMANDLAGEIK